MKNNLVNWSPFREIETSWANLRWPFDSGLPLADAKQTWLPATDIQETENAFMIQTELPGLSKDVIKVHLEDHVLRIEGERAEEKEHKDAKNNTYTERAQGKFLRRFKLPDNINEEKVSASYKDGVLKIDLPKREVKNTSKEIKIQIS